MRRSILLGAACGFGAAGADLLAPTPAGWTVMAAALCLTLGRRWAVLAGSALLAFAIAGSSRAEDGPPPAGDRPATLVVESRAPWRRTEWGFTTRVVARGYRQGARVRRWRSELVVSLGGDERPPPAGRYRLRGYVLPGRRSVNFGTGDRRPPPRVSVRSRVFIEPMTPTTARERFWRASQRVRDAVEVRLGDEPSGRRERALFRALVLGDPTELPVRWTAALRRTGTAHVLAVSGLHVALLLGCLLQPLGAAPRAVRCALGLALLAVYLLLAGPRPSLLRAAVMAGSALLALVCARPAAALPALELAAVGLLAQSPEIVGDLGFRLTFAATAAIVGWGERWAQSWLRCWPRCPRPVARALAATLAAQLATTPLLLPVTGYLPLSGWLVNPLAGVWAAFALASCFVWLAAGLDATAVGRLGSGVVRGCAAALDGLAGVQPAATPVLLLPASAAAGVVVLAAAGWLGFKRRVRGVVALLVVCCLTPGTRRDATLELVVLDVGQGDAVVLRDGRQAWLVDGGGWRRGDIASAVLIPALAALGIERLAGVVVTHADSDHCQGVLDLSRYLGLAKVWLPPGWAAEPCTRELAVRSRGQIGILWRDRDLALGRWRLTVLAPDAGERQAGNDASLVLLAEAAGRRVLLTGDVEAAAERQLVRDFGSTLAPVDLLKLAHHGSKTSTTGELLDAVQPALAVVSAGRDNPYGHPAAVVRDRLRARGVRLLRTDRDGACRFRFAATGRTIETAADMPFRVPFD